MRLLRFDRSRGLVSTDFREKATPPYAILSHRWGDSEVLYEDLGRNTYKAKHGYRKIEFCAEQAAQDQLQYFWIDTCCIDKWNLRERSKAINSMFRWYKNATRCYVFLPDVSAATDASRSAWEASFRASEWFTRGWTLQELIAPVSVEFFSREGRRIGDKASLEPLVHEITGVPLEALRNCPLDDFTTAERKGWAKDRETSEKEDAVYCLLGIFNINLPMAYGEGVDKAWRRLQMELEAASSAPSIIPFSQNEQFVGRESQLAELEARLFGNKRATTMAIVGRAGTGKSQLALEVAHRTRQRNKNCSVFWIDASDMDSLYRSYASIAQKLSIPGWDDEKVDSRQLVKTHLSEKGEKQCLLVFDNTEDVSLGSSGISTGATHIVDYLPHSELCSVLFTTTNSDTAKRLAAPNVVELKEMTPSTAQRMLENHLTQELSTMEAQPLLHELSYLPLAIVQAAAYINARSITTQEYLSQMARERETVLERTSELPEDSPPRCGTMDPVTIAVLISLDQIRRDSELAAEYLFLAACIDRKDIPLDLLEASSPREREDAVKVLSRYALVTRRPAESALDLHQLVHRALRRWLQKLEYLDQWIESAIRWLREVFPDHNHNNRSKWRRLLPHTKYALSNRSDERDNGNGQDLAWKCAMALYYDGRWAEAEELFVQVMETRKTKLGADHPDTLTSMANLGVTYSVQGKEDKAEPLKKQVMEIRKTKLGTDHPSTLSSMANLASTYSNQGRWREAKELDVQTKLGTDHPSTLTSMANLASTYRNQGRWREAEELFVQVMETSKTKLGADHPDTLTSMANLAFTFKGLGRVTQAFSLMQDCCRQQEQVLGPRHPYTVSSQESLAAWRLEAMEISE
ncbi:kinesin light chain 1 [Polyplosphaeria fusca]|uniref:Kinesin light chain 1 n=1 Tax=Polyplosphaeria fusca TaxID=682080 RepID=A0A9P4QRR1_9PLEO|nr:kinesin light chain 1 [Polyplosphaeria fusca]